MEDSWQLSTYFLPLWFLCQRTWRFIDVRYDSYKRNSHNCGCPWPVGLPENSVRALPVKGVWTTGLHEQLGDRCPFYLSQTVLVFKYVQDFSVMMYHLMWWYSLRCMHFRFFFLWVPLWIFFSLWFPLCFPFRRVCRAEGAPNVFVFFLCSYLSRKYLRDDSTGCEGEYGELAAYAVP